MKDKWDLVWDDKFHCHYERKGRMIRDWLEGQRWYWFTLTFDITPFPWHWQMEYTNYKWGIRILCGPIGVMMIWPQK